MKWREKDLGGGAGGQSTVPTTARYTRVSNALIRGTESPLDRWALEVVPPAEPIERCVKLVFVDGSELEHRAQARSGGLAIEHARSGCLRRRRDNTVDHHGDDQVAAAIVGGAQHVVQSDGA